MNLTSACIAHPPVHQRIANGLLARVDRVHIDGHDFAIKTFRPGALSAWAREVASHLICPQPEVIALASYGRNESGAGWLSSPWVDAPTVRQCKRDGNATIEAAAIEWITEFQTRLAALYFRWVDASPRNLLVMDGAQMGGAPRFGVVDYTIRPLAENPSVGADSAFTRAPILGVTHHCRGLA